MVFETPGLKCKAVDLNQNPFTIAHITWTTTFTTAIQ